MNPASDLTPQPAIPLASPPPTLPRREGTTPLAPLLVVKDALSILPKEDPPNYWTPLYEKIEELDARNSGGDISGAKKDFAILASDFLSKSKLVLEFGLDDELLQNCLGRMVSFCADLHAQEIGDQIVSLVHQLYHRELPKDPVIAKKLIIDLAACALFGEDLSLAEKILVPTTLQERVSLFKQLLHVVDDSRTDDSIPDERIRHSLKMSLAFWAMTENVFSQLELYESCEGPIPISDSAEFKAARNFYQSVRRYEKSVGDKTQDECSKNDAWDSLYRAESAITRETGTPRLRGEFAAYLVNTVLSVANKDHVEHVSSRLRSMLTWHALDKAKSKETSAKVSHSGDSRLSRENEKKLLEELQRIYDGFVETVWPAEGLPSLIFRSNIAVQARNDIITSVPTLGQKLALRIREFESRLLELERLLEQEVPDQNPEVVVVDVPKLKLIKQTTETLRSISGLIVDFGTDIVQNLQLSSLASTLDRNGLTTELGLERPLVEDAREHLEELSDRLSHLAASYTQHYQSVCLFPDFVKALDPVLWRYAESEVNPYLTAARATPEFYRFMRFTDSNWTTYGVYLYEEEHREDVKASSIAHWIRTFKEEVIDFVQVTRVTTLPLDFVQDRIIDYFSQIKEAFSKEALESIWNAPCSDQQNSHLQSLTQNDPIAIFTELFDLLNQRPAVLEKYPSHTLDRGFEELGEHIFQMIKTLPEDSNERTNFLEQLIAIGSVTSTQIEEEEDSDEA